MLLPVLSAYGSGSTSGGDLTSEFSVPSWCCFAAAQILTSGWLTLMAETSFGLLQFSRGRSGGVSGVLGTQPCDWASFTGCGEAEPCSAGAAVP